MIWVFFVIAGDSLGPVDSLQTPPDTSLPAAVVQTADTTKKDTIWTYEVPHIVALEGKNTLGNAITAAEMPGSRDYQYTFPEVFSASPYFLLKKNNSVLMTTRACDPLLARYYLNEHPLCDRFNGFIDMNGMPVSCPVRITASRNAGGNLIGIGLISKINKYERPFSILNFTTLGDNTIYNVDFTRALTDDMGLYFSGLYSNIFKLPDNLYHKLNAYNGNIYFNKYLPMRFDFLYSSSEYGAEEKNSISDVSLTADIMQNKLCVYYSRFGASWADTTGDSSANESRNFGLVTETVKRTPFCDLYLGLDGVIFDVITDHEGAFDGGEGRVFTGLGKTWNRLVLCADNSTDFSNDGGIRLSPQLVAGYCLFDSTFITGSVSCGFREPVITETDAPIDTAVCHPNPDLQTESWMNKEIGLKRGNFSVAVYDLDFDDYIVWAQPDPRIYFVPQNRGSRSFSGAEGVIGFPLGNFLIFTVAGNYLFSGEPDQYLPSRHLASSITLKHESARSMQAIVVQGQYLSERAGPNGPGFPDAGVVSIIGLVRFITMTAVLKVENILDQDVLFTPIPRLNTSLSLKWEFWD